MQTRQTEKRFLEYVRETALPKLIAGDAVYGRILQRVFLKFPKEKQLQKEIAAAYENILEKISTKKLIRISEVYRNQYDEWFVEDDAADWWYNKPQKEDYPHLTVDEYNAVLKFGTFLEDGFDRQWCMEALEDAPGSLAFFFLRLNDWVGEIRESAFLLAEKRLALCGADEFFFALPMLEKVAVCGRRDEKALLQISAQVFSRALKIFEEMPGEILNGRLPYYGVNIKNAIYRLFRQKKFLSLSQMEQLLDAEWTGYGKKLLLEGIFFHYGYEKKRVERYLTSRSTLVRYRALWFRYQNEGTVEGLEKMLLDRSQRIRRDVSYLLKKHKNFKVLDYYLEELQRGISETVLLGIGEHGTKKEIRIIEPFLAEKGNRLARAALVSYGRLAAEQGEKVYWKFLFDDRSSIAKTAYRLIIKNRIHYGANELYSLFCEYHQPVIRKYLFRLLLCEPSWERLPYLLELYAFGELSEEEEWKAWHGIQIRNVYAVISRQQEQRILEILERGGEKFSEELKKEILFDLAHIAKK